MFHAIAHRLRRGGRAALAFLPLIAVAACGGGGGGGGSPPTPAPPTYSIGGTVTGLTGTGLVLQNNGGDNRSITANGAFTFTTRLASGAAYVVTVATRPSTPSQTCIVANSSGNVAGGNVTGIRVACGPPAGKFLYVTADDPVLLRSFRIDAINGGLTPLTGPTGPTGSNPVFLTPDPSERFLYTANTGSGDISAYSIDSNTGVLSGIAGSPFPVGTSPYTIRFRPDGAFVYVTYYPDSIAAFSVNATAGTLAPVASYVLGLFPSEPVIDPAGRFLYVASGAEQELHGYSIDVATGALTPVPGSPYFVTEPANLALGPGGTVLYVSNDSPTAIPDTSNVLAYAINAVTGALTAIGTPVGMGVAGGRMELSADGRFLFVANSTNSGGGTVTSFVVDQTTGTLAAAPGPSIQVGTGAVVFDVDPSGRYVAAFAQLGTAASLIGVNETTGALGNTTLSPFGYSPIGGLLDRSGMFSYVLQYGGDRVYPYQIDPVGRSVVELPFVTVGGAQPRFAIVVGSQ